MPRTMDGHVNPFHYLFYLWQYRKMFSLLTNNHKRWGIIISYFLERKKSCFDSPSSTLDIRSDSMLVCCSGTFVKKLQLLSRTWRLSSCGSTKLVAQWGQLSKRSSFEISALYWQQRSRLLTCTSHVDAPLWYVPSKLKHHWIQWPHKLHTFSSMPLLYQVLSI